MARSIRGFFLMLSARVSSPMLYAALALLVATRGSLCQAPGAAVVRVSVTSRDGMPLSGADVVIAWAAQGLLSGVTDERGRFDFSLTTDTGAYSVIARKIGFAAGTRLINPVAGQSLDITIVLSSVALSLDTVRTIAEQLRSKNYRIDAADIAGDHRAIYDAYDAALKLRPNMLGDRGRLCPSVAYVWINGRRVFWKSPPSPMARRVYTSPAPTSRIVAPSTHAAGGAAPTVPDFLRSVKSEDIAEMRYVNCWDTSMPELGTNNALFITLKPGIAWDWKNGSHPVDTLTSGLRVAAYPRLLGVYDEKTGMPIEGAEVYDSVTTLAATTTVTGTISLGFLRPSGAVLVIRKSGYALQKVAVSLTANDTTPITLMLTPVRP